MSFSSDVKTELAELREERACCRTAEAYGMAEFGHAFSSFGVSLQTENEMVARLYAELLEESGQASLAITEGKRCVEETGFGDGRIR